VSPRHCHIDAPRTADLRIVLGVPRPGRQHLAIAGDHQPAARPRRTIIHFGEDDIRGDITRPDGELVQAPRRVAEGSLLRMRRSFIDRALSGAARGE